MTLKLPPGVKLNGVEPGEPIADSQWPEFEKQVEDEVPFPPSRDFVLPRTIAAQLREDADL